MKSELQIFIYHQKSTSKKTKYLDIYQTQRIHSTLTIRISEILLFLENNLQLELSLVGFILRDK